MPPKGSKKEPKPPPPPDAANPLKFTNFNVVGFLNGKNVASNFSKNENQTWWSRRSNEEECEKEREGKRRRLMASEEELEEEQARLDGLGEGEKKIELKVLEKAPENGVRPRVIKAPESSQSDEDQETLSSDPLSKTIIIHPGSRWLRIGRASDAFPVTVPNVIASKVRPSSSLKMMNGKGKGRAMEVNGNANGTTTTTTTTTALSAPVIASAVASTSVEMDLDDDDDDDELSDSSPPPITDDTDPISAKIHSIRGDLRARMRIFKLRGQGNGNAQAAEYNEQVVPENLPDYNDPSEVEWTDTKTDSREFYVGEKALRIPDAESAGYTLRHPYDRGTFNTSSYSSPQEFLLDIQRIWLTTLEEELEINKEELKDYSAILLIPDLYDHVYVREMTELILRGVGFKQVCIQQESICATFGAGISTACVIDIGASKTSITCVEEGLILPETRMVLDFAGDDITEFLLTLLTRNKFPYKEVDLARYHDFLVLQDLKERMIVLSENDVGLNIYDFYVRRPSKPTKKYTLRVYDDVILAPYALFAPRVIDFDKKTLPVNDLWSKDVEDIVEIGGNAVTNAMKSSTRHLLPVVPALPPIPESTAETITGSPLPPLPSDAAYPPSGVGTPMEESTPIFGTLPPLPPSAVAGSPAPSVSGVEGTETATPAPGPKVATTRQPTPVKEPTIDVRLESSKLPLDVAVVESILAAGSEDRMKKICQNLLIVGGSGLIHNVGFAVESRISPALAARMPSLAGQVAVVPPPREIDPRILAWKGISVLPKLDSASELWIRREDYEALGMRAIRERAFFFA